MNHYTLNEETPKAVCTLNSKGGKKEEKEEGRRRKERGRRRESDLDRATLIVLYGRSATVLYSILSCPLLCACIFLSVLRSFDHEGGNGATTTIDNCNVCNVSYMTNRLSFPPLRFVFCIAFANICDICLPVPRCRCRFQTFDNDAMTTKTEFIDLRDNRTMTTVTMTTTTMIICDNQTWSVLLLRSFNGVIKRRR